MFKSPWSRRGGLAVAVVGSCAIAFRLGLPADTSQGMVEVDGLAVPASALDFGTVWESSAFHWYLPIQNRTRADIHIDQFEVSCNCLKVEPKQLLLQPGEKADIALTLDLTPRHYDEIGLAERPLRLQIRPHRLGDRFGSAWTLQGNVKSRLVLDTRSLEFGEAPYHGGPAAWREVTATSFVPARGLQVKAEPALALVQVAPVTSSPTPQNGRFLLKVAPLPSLPPGAFQFNLVMKIIQPDGAVLPGAILPVTGTMQPEVRPLPARIWFSSQAVGTTATATVILQVPAGEQWVVDHIDMESPGVTVMGAESSDPAGRPTFVVKQRVDQEGDHESTVRFVVRKDKSGPPVALVVRVAYHGAPARPAPDPSGARSQAVRCNHETRRSPFSHRSACRDMPALDVRYR